MEAFKLIAVISLFVGTVLCQMGGHFGTMGGQGMMGPSMMGMMGQPNQYGFGHGMMPGGMYGHNMMNQPGMMGNTGFTGNPSSSTGEFTCPTPMSGMQSAIFTGNRPGIGAGMTPGNMMTGMGMNTMDSMMGGMGRVRRSVLVRVTRYAPQDSLVEELKDEQSEEPVEVQTEPLAPKDSSKLTSDTVMASSSGNSDVRGSSSMQKTCNSHTECQIQGMLCCPNVNGKYTCTTPVRQGGMMNQQMAGNAMAGGMGLPGGMGMGMPGGAGGMGLGMGMGGPGGMGMGMPGGAGGMGMGMGMGGPGGIGMEMPGGAGGMGMGGPGGMGMGGMGGMF